MNNEVFEVLDGVIIINEFNRMIPEFRFINCQQDILYIYHMGSYKSPYSNYDSSIKETKVINDFCSGITITSAHKVAVNKFIELQETPNMRLYRASIKASDEVTKFLSTVRLDERDEKGRPIYKATEVTTAMEKLGKMVESQRLLKEQVMKEQAAATTARGGYRPSEFEQ